MTAQSRHGQPNWVRPLLCTAALAVLAVAALPTLLYPLTRDQGAYAYIADLMMKGGVPYRDALDLKPPAVYLVYGLSFALFGRSEFAVRLFDVLFALVSGASIYLLAHEVFHDRRIAALSAWIYAFCYYLWIHFYAAANPESFMVPVLTTSVLGTVRALRTRSKNPLFLTGVAGGFAFWFKPTAGVIVVAALAWMVAKMWQEQRRTSSVLRNFTFVILGGLLGLLPTALYLYGRGLRELMELWRDYGTGAYLGARGLALGEGPLAVLDVIVGHLRHWQLLVWLSLAGMLGVLMRRERHGSGGAVVVYLLSTLAATLLQGKLFEYHWIPVLAPAAILAAGALAGLASEISGPTKNLLRNPLSAWRDTDMRTLFAVIVLVGLLLWTGYDQLARYRQMAAYLAGRLTEEQYYAQFDIGTDFSRMGTLRAATYLREQTEPDETVLIWGAEPLVHFLSQRRSATKYIFSYMLVGDDGSPRIKARRQDFLDDVRKADPAYVVLVERDITPLTPMGSLAQLDEFPAFKILLETAYYRDAQVEDYLFYRRKARDRASLLTSDEESFICQT
jgi:4-amino-4-deoxy-L-arabinose transferase-like glycosyltransferase